jgi:hypothetical protein
VGIVKLDRNFLVELIELSSDRISAAKLGALVSSNNILKGSTDDEILLLETEFFSFEEVIIRIENLRDIFSNVSIEHGLNVVASVEKIEVEASCSTSRPETHGVDDIVAITRSRRVVWESNDSLRIPPL